MYISKCYFQLSYLSHLVLNFMSVSGFQTDILVEEWSVSQLVWIVPVYFDVKLTDCCEYFVKLIYWTTESYGNHGIGLYCHSVG